MLSQFFLWLSVYRESAQSDMDLNGGPLGILHKHASICYACTVVLDGRAHTNNNKLCVASIHFMHFPCAHNNQLSGI